MKIDAPRPPWRAEFLHDLPALQRFAKEVTAWQAGFPRCAALL
jgi:hypothetical protein